MSTTLDICKQTIVALVRDDKQLQPGDYLIALKRALQTYSQFRPKRKSQTLIVGGNSSILTANIAEFDEGFINQMMIEYPITQSGPPIWLDSAEWCLQDLDAGQAIRFFTIPSGESVRIVHRCPHQLPTDDQLTLTVRESDAQAVCSLAAAECLQMLGDKYSSQASETNVLTADIAHFMSKGQDCEARGNKLRAGFYDHLKAATAREAARPIRLARG
jgi:hypothetical protein